MKASRGIEALTTIDESLVHYAQIFEKKTKNKT